MIAESRSELPESTLVAKHFGCQIKSVKKRRSFPQSYLQPTFYQHVKISMMSRLAEDVEQCLAIDKDLQQETLSDEASSAPSQMGFQTTMMATTSLIMLHPSYLIRIE
ncbi:hypothetical protein AVEN_264690-1 [Araneus ventricosus]|uniref:Uncharacterized protein n=1 Tax=Araneus ventricosus TaxID=182803 RepID=A0A4Y2THG1_ARAVE|nr:hypothetical protein AVEN_264690-1 [Araneus ventricosus]